MDGQNTVLTGWNAFEWLNQEFAWHAHDVRMACKRHKREKFELSHSKGVKTAT